MRRAVAQLIAFALGTGLAGGCVLSSYDVVDSLGGGSGSWIAGNAPTNSCEQGGQVYCYCAHALTSTACDATVASQLASSCNSNSPAEVAASVRCGASHYQSTTAVPDCNAFLSDCFSGNGPDGGTTGGMGSGGDAGSTGTGGGDAGACTDSMYPKACPALGTVPAGCWTAATDCSTVTDCGAGDYKACSSPDDKVDCTTMKCVCANGKTDCSGTCIDVQTDPDNCGSCGHACSTGQSCFAGTCCSTPAAGGNCNLPACGCASGEVCYPKTPATGLACFASNALGDGADCTNAQCASGLGCFGNLCHPYCQTDADCTLIDGVRHCGGTTWASNGDAIPGVSVCSRICDPVTPQTPQSPLLGCPAGFGCQVSTSAAGTSNCLKQSGASAPGGACTASSDCPIGYFCSTANLCRKYCYTNTDCPGQTCSFFTTPIQVGSRQVGACN